MKNLFSIVALFFVALLAAQSANATVQVRLFPVQSIEVNPLQTTVQLDYKNKADYLDGVTNVQENHVSVFSTGGFTVSVKTDSPTMENTLNSETISSSDLKILAGPGTNNTISGGNYFPEISLSTTSTPIFSNTTGGVSKNFNITYRSEGNLNKYINKYFKNQSPTVYSTKVIYEIIPS